MLMSLIFGPVNNVNYMTGAANSKRLIYTHNKNTICSNKVC